VGDGETGSEDGVALGTYSHLSPSMQEQAANAITEMLVKEMLQRVAKL
jgi:hypothetical protein